MKQLNNKALPLVGAGYSDDGELIPTTDPIYPDDETPTPDEHPTMAELFGKVMRVLTDADPRLSKDDQLKAIAKRVIAFQWSYGLLPGKPSLRELSNQWGLGDAGRATLHKYTRIFDRELGIQVRTSHKSKPSSPFEPEGKHDETYNNGSTVNTCHEEAD